MVNENLYNALVGYGLSATQAKSKTAEAVVDVLLADEIKRVKAVNARLADIEDVMNSDGERIRKILDSFQKLADVTGELQSADAKDALLLWREMLRVAVADFRVDPDRAAHTIGYIMYALYGGEAKMVQIYERDAR